MTHLLRRHLAAKRRAPNDFERTRPRARRRSVAVAVGNRAETGALREEGPGRLCGDHPPRRYPARHPLDSRRPRAVDLGSLLADGI